MAFNFKNALFALSMGVITLATISLLAIKIAIPQVSRQVLINNATLESLNDHDVIFNLIDENKVIEDFRSVQKWENNSKVRQTLSGSSLEINDVKVDILDVQLVNNNAYDIFYTISQNGLESQEKRFRVEGFMRRAEKLVAHLNNHIVSFSVPENSKKVSDFDTLEKWNNSPLVTQNITNTVLGRGFALSEVEVDLEKVEVLRATNATSSSISLTYTISKDGQISAQKVFVVPNFKTPSDLKRAELNKLSVIFNVREEDRIASQFDKVVNWNNNPKVTYSLTSTNINSDLNPNRYNIVVTALRQNSTRDQYTLTYYLQEKDDPSMAKSSPKQFTITRFRLSDEEVLQNVIDELNRHNLNILINQSYRNFANFNSISDFRPENSNGNIQYQILGDRFEINNIDVNIKNFITNFENNTILVTYTLSLNVLESDLKTITLSGFTS